MVIVIMGAAGAGKTTVGRALAQTLGWDFLDADDFHDARSIARMRRRIALTDEDRAPWLGRIHAAMTAADREGRNVVVACSALRESYRQVLATGIGRVVFVYLDAPASLLHERLRHRTGHFMPEALVESQLATLEAPADAVRVDAAEPIDSQISEIRDALTL